VHVVPGTGIFPSALAARATAIRSIGVARRAGSDAIEFASLGEARMDEHVSTVGIGAR
jgi:hypothetical protein